MERFHFPAWANLVAKSLPALVLFAPIYLLGIAWFATASETTEVGYRPDQPVPFSHKLHAGQLKMDCRYCHTTVETASHAAVPPTSTCINCHSPADVNGNVELTAVHANSPKLREVHKSHATGKPIEWQNVHDLADYAYFNHSAHVARGVSCVSCHGRVDQMEVVRQVEPLSMKWCLECHRKPQESVRPLDKVTDLNWIPTEESKGIDKTYLHYDLDNIKGHEGLKINPLTNCSTCHR